LQDVEQLDLGTAQEIALADNPSLAAAAERVEQARQRMDQARALYYPSVDAGASMLHSNPAHDEPDMDLYGASIGASWLVFDGFSRKFSNLIAEYGQQESEQARRDAQRLLLQSVAVSYYGAQLALYNKTIAEADFSFNSKQAGEAKLSMNAGAGSLSAVLNFQVQMNNASTEILLAERNYDLAMYGLAVLLGRKSGKMPDGLHLAKVAMVDGSQFFAIEADTLLELARKNRPDLIRSDLAFQRADSVVGVKQAAYYPTVALQGGLEGTRRDDISFESNDFGSAIGVNLSYNLFRGRSDAAKIAEARAAKRESARILEQQKNVVQSEVLQAITNLEQARAQLILQRQSVKLVTQTRDLVEEGYKAGQESLARFNEVQRDLVRTQSRLALSLISLYTNRFTLKTATGESLLPFMERNSLVSE
jgi:outer membrane protein TolC